METELYKEENQDSNPKESDAYSLYLYGMRSPITRDTYLRRLRIFFNHIQLLSNEQPMDVRCNLFVDKSRTTPGWAFSQILNFLQFQKERVEKREISPATLKNFVKAIKLLCEMTDIEIGWKRITRGLPKTRRYADDRAPTLLEIQKIAEYPDRRIRALLYTMASSGIRLSAWDYLQWGHIRPIKRDGKIVAAKVIVYAGDPEEYFTFITFEAYNELEKWMEYRKEAGEEITEKSWLMRWKWDTKKGHNRGLVTAPRKLETIGIKRLINDALWAQGVRKKSQLIGRRYDFQADHGLRKWFKTRLELSGMKSINIEILMGRSLGLSDSYYRVTENELLEDYLKVQNILIIDSKNQLENQIKEQTDRNQQDNYIIRGKLLEKDEEIKKLNEHYQSEIKSLREDMETRFQQLISRIDSTKL
ncbi:MAG: hypothetical protein AB7V56_06450 [Candidatus Nitrosocosmicus sp.]